MIDFHAHILPDIDDGARNFRESVSMLRMLSSQGVTKVVLTPHFYPGETDLTDFLKARSEKLSLLLEKLYEKKEKGEAFPEIAVGAEVFFFPTIYSLADIDKLCIMGTNYLLLEMPFKKWTQSVFDTVHKLISNRGIIPVIAHVDRYIPFGNGKNEIVQLKELGALIQINSDFFCTFSGRRKAFSYIKASLADVIGSDCHSTGSRRPEIGKAEAILLKKFGEDKIKQINSLSEKILKSAVLK